MSFLTCRFVVVGFASGILASSTGLGRAETVTLRPTADTTLIQAAPDSNLGGASFFNAGTAGNGNNSRALVMFGLQGAIPAGAVIESVSLSFDIVRQPVDDWQSSLFGLHRINVSWAEGNKVPEDGSPGLGAPATEGEATWNHRFFGGATWAAPGGEAGLDFAVDPSSTSFVFGMGDPVVFESSAALIGDVQDWVNRPGENRGWLMMTESEGLRKSARSFASREDGTGGPTLTVSFTVVPEPGTVAILGAGLALFGIFAWWRRR